MAHHLQFTNVSFSYDGMNEVLFDSVDLSLAEGWTGVVGSNGSGKTTLLLLAAGIIRPNAGTVSAPGDALYAHQRTDTPPPLAKSFISADDGEAWRIKGILDIEYDWLDRWETLSHGERKRLQIGAGLWANPSLLAVDEPTNHLDAKARGLIEEGLLSYRGVGLLVSHDRDLLDTITQRTIIVGESNVELRSGPFSSAWQERNREIGEMRDRYLQEKRSLEKMRKEENRRRQLADQQHARRSKKGIPIKDHDARFKKNHARVTGRDGVGGKLLRQMDGRLSQAEHRLASYRTEKDRKMGIHVESVRVQSDALFVSKVESLPLGGSRTLHLPDLVIDPRSRIGISGPNGGGKSTLVRHIVATQQGTRNKIIYIPQEIALEESAVLRDRMLALSKDELGLVLSVVSRLGTQPERLLSSTTLSPGETRKLMLALGIHSSPAFIIMDEPTNHMDIPSIESLESALAETVCALLLVSHDRRFLDGLVSRYWIIEPDAESDDTTLRIELI